MMSSVSSRNRPKHLQIVTPEEELENLKNEVGVLHRAVESKSAAVGILRAELQECQKERDKFRTLAEQGGGTPLRRPPALTPAKAALTDPGRSAMLSGADGTLAQLLCQAKEENRMLRQEATELRCRLHDAQADTKVLREEVQRWRGGGDGRRGSQANAALTQLALQERERFISQMETLSAKCQALEGDVRGLVEEREELVRELDATHHKLHRLNYILNTVLNSPQHSTTSPTTPAPVPPKRIVDLDAIITENRYLQQRLKQAEEEMTLARSNSSKYKSALERCRSQGSVKLGTSESLIVTPKQVSELLQEYRGEVGGLAESDLRSLCVALVDALSQRSRALRTQRLANRVLVNRVNELERRLLDQGVQGSNGSGVSVQSGSGNEATPADLPLATQELMEGYMPPADRGGLAWVKEEDVSRDPRLLKFLGRLSAPQPPSHSRDAGDGGDREQQMNGGIENRSDTKRMAREKVESANRTNVESGMMSDVVNSKNQRSKEEEDLTNVATNGVTHNMIKVDEEDEEEEEDAPLLPADPHQPQKHTEDDLEEIVPLDQLDAYIKEVHMNRRRTVQKGKAEKRNVKNEKGGLTEERKDTEVEKGDGERGNKETEHKQEISAQKKGNKGDRKETKDQKGEADEGRGEADRERREAREQKDENETRKEGKTDIVKTEKEIDTMHKNTTEQKNYNKSNQEEEDREEDDDDESIDLDLSDYDSDNDKLDLALEEWKNDCGGKKQGGEGTSPARGGKKKATGGKREGFRLWRKEQKSSTDIELPSALQALLDKAAAGASLDDSGWTT